MNPDYYLRECQCDRCQEKRKAMKTKWASIVKIVAIGVIGILCVSAGIAIGKITVRPVDQPAPTKPVR